MNFSQRDKRLSLKGDVSQINVENDMLDTGKLISKIIFKNLRIIAINASGYYISCYFYKMIKICATKIGRKLIYFITCYL